MQRMPLALSVSTKGYEIKSEGGAVSWFQEGTAERGGYFLKAYGKFWSHSFSQVIA